MDIMTVSTSAHKHAISGSPTVMRGSVRDLRHAIDKVIFHATSHFWSNAQWQKLDVPLRLAGGV